MGLPPSFLLAFHWTDIEVEDFASTDTMVGAEGANMCVMVVKILTKHINLAPEMTVRSQLDNKVASQATPFVEKEWV